jgi:hypothetical protein
MPRIVDELLGRELVAPPRSTEVIPSPSLVEGRVTEGVQWQFAPMALRQWEPQ